MYQACLVYKCWLLYTVTAFSKFSKFSPYLFWSVSLTLYLFQVSLKLWCILSPVCLLHGASYHPIILQNSITWNIIVCILSVTHVIFHKSGYLIFKFWMKFTSIAWWNNLVKRLKCIYELRAWRWRWKCL